MLDDRLRSFLREDFSIEWTDVGNEIAAGTDCRANVIAREKGLVAGVREVEVLYDILDVETDVQVHDGGYVKEDDEVLEVQGDAASVLRGERLALNLMGSMSGIATVTRQLVDRSEETVVAGTRKTTPGFRDFEKRAVKLGGGDPHRLDLSDMVMVKENHIEVLGLEVAMGKAVRESSYTSKVEVEAETIGQAVKASELGADIVLLDNMSPKKVKKAIETLEDHDVLIEVSGGVWFDNVEDYALDGVDVVSIGGLVHSSEWLDYSMRVSNG
ncbi:MAG: carboxylating nicotinate-nucleotide diphosphorylase [Halobacteria archaeon]